MARVIPTYSYGHLFVITGSIWDYTFYKWCLLVLITGCYRADRVGGARWDSDVHMHFHAVMMARWWWHVDDGTLMLPCWWCHGGGAWLNEDATLQVGCWGGVGREINFRHGDTALVTLRWWCYNADGVGWVGVGWRGFGWWVMNVPWHMHASHDTTLMLLRWWWCCWWCYADDVALMKLRGRRGAVWTRSNTHTHRYR